MLDRNHQRKAKYEGFIMYKTKKEAPVILVDLIYKSLGF